MKQSIERTGSWWQRLLAGAAAVALFAALPAQAVQLKSGEMLLGEIKTPDENGFQLVRFDTGGQLQLRWDQLAPASAERLKQVYSLVAEVTELTERVDNTLQVTEDVYLARIHTATLELFRVPKLSAAVDRKLSIIRETYIALYEEAGSRRAELLEAAIVLLIMFEIGLALVGH